MSEETQVDLFPQDEDRKKLQQLDGKIGMRAGEVRKALENTKEFINLIKDGPRLVADMYFRCGELPLAKETLHLLRSQATELSCIFDETERSLSVIEDWKSQKEEIKERLAAATAEPTEEQLEHGPDYEAQAEANEGNSEELENIATALLADAEEALRINEDVQSNI